MIVQTQRQRSIILVLLAVFVGFALGAIAFDWAELRSFGVRAFRRAAVAKHTNVEAEAKLSAARLPLDIVPQILQHNPNLDKADAPKLVVKWIYDDWAFGSTVYYQYELHFLARYANGKWKLLDEADCRGMSFVRKHNVPSAIVNRLVKESWLQPEYDALYKTVAQDWKHTLADPNGGSTVISVDWISGDWANGCAGDDGGQASFLACKKNGKWKVLDYAQDVKPMSTVQKYGIPGNIVNKLIESGWFDPKVDAEEAERKRHADAPGTTSLSEGIRIVSCNWYKMPDYGTDGAIECVGQVENYGNTTARYVRVSVSFHDRQGRVVDTDYGYTDPPDIPPGRRVPFKIYSDYWQSAATVQIEVSCDNGDYP